MADNVKLEDMNEEQLRNAVGSLIQQLQQADATIRDLGVKVANKEIENSRFRSILGAIPSTASVHNCSFSGVFSLHATLLDCDFSSLAYSSKELMIILLQ